MHLASWVALRRRPRRVKWRVAAVQAVIAATVVSAMAWAAIAEGESTSRWSGTLSPAWRGLVTMGVFLVAGWLLALFFGRLDEAVQGYRATGKISTESDE